MRDVGAAALRLQSTLGSIAVASAIGASATQAAGQARVPIVQPATLGVPWTSDGRATLATDLDALLASRPLRGAHAGVLVVDTASGATLYAHAADDEFQPASTLKLLVGSAALDFLKPTFRFRTTLAEATLDGSSTQTTPPFALVLRAQGDPTLSTADLTAGVAALPREAAIGSVFVDDRAFDAVPYPDGWTWDDFGQEYAPRISAATLDENVMTLVVAPGLRPRDAAVARYPDGSPVAPASADCPTFGPLRVRNDATTGSAASDDSLDVAPTLGGCARLVGAQPLGAAPRAVRVAVADPRQALDAALRRALRARGIEPGESQTPGRVLQAPFWTHDSAALGDLLGPRFWIPSDNLFAEDLLKTLGRAAAGDPGTTASGIAYEKTWLQSLGVDPATVTLADGCGMSQYDRVTPRALVTILEHDWNGPSRQLVLDALPVGGARGTIEGIAGTSVAGRVFAKTGSMMHVRGLAGYLATLRHGAVTFAFTVDDWNGDYASLAALRAQVLSRIAGD